MLQANITGYCSQGVSAFQAGAEQCFPVFVGAVARGSMQRMLLVDTAIGHFFEDFAAPLMHHR